MSQTFVENKVFSLPKMLLAFWAAALISFHDQWFPLPNLPGEAYRPEEAHGPGEGHGPREVYGPGEAYGPKEA